MNLAPHAEKIAQALDPKAKRVNGSWSCRCPAHEDKHASLSLSEKDGRLLWRCHSGCSQADVQAELHKRGLLGNRADTAATPRTKPDKADDDWRPIAPVPDGAAEPGFTHAEYGKPSRTWTYRDAGGRVLFYVARFDPAGERKRIIPRCWGTLKGRTGWHWRHPATPRPLYRLDDLAARPADPVLIVEGEKAADAAAVILSGYVAVTWPGGSNAAGHADWSVLKGRCTMIWPDHDEPGRKAAEQIRDALLEIAAAVRIVDPPADLPESWDLADEAPDGLDLRALLDQAERHVDRLERLVEEAETDPGAPFESEAVDFLAALRDRDKADYERTRARLKKAGVRIGALDQEVERRKPEATAAAPAAADEIEPWSEPVDGDELMTGLVDAIKRYAILQTEAQATAVALWVVHSHTIESAEVAPRLLINSPVPECGKTVLLGVVGRLVPRPEISSNISPAALFRTIEQVRPTVLVDEADTFLAENDELRGLLNSGHTRTSAYTRRIEKVGEALVSTKFSTWASICIAGIGKLHYSITSRSIVVTMQRKLASQKVDRLLSRGGKDLDVLGRKIARWVADHQEQLATLADVLPDLPGALGNRSADNWIELIGLADLIGGKWPAAARRAAVEISTNLEVDDQTYGVQLLGDIKAVFDSTKAEAIWTEDLLRHLHAMSERPWPEYGRQRKPITTRQLASLLKGFGVHSGDVRIGESHKKGYKRSSLAPAWSRYATTRQATESTTFDDFPSATKDPLSRQENRPKPTAPATCRVVADKKASDGRKEGNGDASASFAPGADWSDVPPGAVLPPGCQIKMDMTTGRQEARRERVADCPACRFAVFADNAVQIEDGAWLHPACAHRWGEQ